MFDNERFLDKDDELTEIVDDMFKKQETDSKYWLKRQNETIIQSE